MSRSIVKVGTKVSDYRSMLKEVWEIMRLDSKDCFEVVHLGNNVSFVGQFFHPNENQKVIFHNIEDLNDTQIAGAVTMVESVKM